MKNYVESGNDLTLTAPTGGVVSGTPVQIGQLLVVPTISAAQTKPFSCKTRGVFENMTKTAGQTWAEGQPLFWTGSAFTTTAGTNLHVGCAAAVAESADVLGKVFLQGISRPDES